MFGARRHGHGGGDCGTATAGDCGTAAAGVGGTATAGACGTATAGACGIIAVRYDDGSRARLVVGYVGEDGVLPDVAYCVRAGKLAQKE